jgi:hypothetical protein
LFRSLELQSEGSEVLVQLRVEQIHECLHEACGEQRTTVA